MIIQSAFFYERLVFVLTFQRLRFRIYVSQLVTQVTN